MLLISFDGRWGTREHGNEPTSGDSFSSWAAVISSTKVKDKPFVCTGWNHVGNGVVAPFILYGG